MNFKEIVFATNGSIGTVTLNNPSKINALSQLMINEIIGVLTEIATDEAIKVVIIKAAGRHFSAGHDLNEMKGKGIKEYQAIFAQCTRMMQLVHELPQPVIAQVQGIATAAGCQLVAWCDLAVAEEDAKFATPGVKIGLFCTTPAVAIVRAIGRKAAMEMLLTGRYYTAAEAKTLGLINQVVSKENLEAATEQLARQIAEASRFALAVGKKGFYSQVDQTDLSAMEYATRTMAMSLTAEDAQNGIAAFLAKQPPKWVNR